MSRLVAVIGGTASGGDFTLVAGTVTLAPLDTSESISIAITDDSADEPNETVIIGLSNPSNAAPGVTNIEMPMTPERVWRAIQAARSG